MTAKRKEYICWESYFLGLAALASFRSKDPNTQNGACIVDSISLSPLSIGYNGFPRGCSDDEFPWGRESKVKSETKYPYVEHAERNAIFNAARNKGSLKSPSTLLIYLIQEKAWDGKKDKHKTWDHWYIEKNLIVSTRSVDQMAADLGVHRGTITRWSAALEKDGLIIKRKEGLETIYILGKVVNGKELYYYCGDIEPDKSDSN